MRFFRFTFVVAIFSILVIVGIFIFTSKKKAPKKEIVIEKAKTFNAVLYYLDDEGNFKDVEKALQWYPLMEDRIKEVIDALCKPDKGFISAIPQSTKVINVFLREDTVYVDFSQEFISNHPGGTRAELETVYSIVNSIIDTFDGVNKVKILVDGKEIDTIKGHVYLGEPLVKNTEVLSESQ